MTSAQRLGFKPVADWLEDVGTWQRLSAGEGAKGPRLYDWAYRPYRSDTAPGWQKGLLIRRKIAKPDQLTFDLTLSPAAATLPDLVRVAGTRWTIEACFEAAKGEVGLDHYEVRSWTGWHRRITLSMLAHASLTIVRKTAVGGTGGDRSQDRPSAAYGAGGTPPRLASGLGAPARSRSDPGLVDVATTPPAAR